MCVCGLHICKLIIMHILEVVIRNTSILQFSRNSPRAHHPPCCSHWGSPNLCPRPPELQSFTHHVPEWSGFRSGCNLDTAWVGSWVIFVPLCSAQTRRKIFRMSPPWRWMTLAAKQRKQKACPAMMRSLWHSTAWGQWPNTPEGKHKAQPNARCTLELNKHISYNMILNKRWSIKQDRHKCWMTFIWTIVMRYPAVYQLHHVRILHVIQNHNNIYIYIWYDMIWYDVMWYDMIWPWNGKICIFLYMYVCVCVCVFIGNPIYTHPPATNHDSLMESSAGLGHRCCILRFIPYEATIE